MAFLLPACLGAMFQVLLNNDKFLALGWILSGIILYFWGKKLHNKETLPKIVLEHLLIQGYF